MNLKSQKGITMMSLVIYVASFLVVASIVSGITIFFYNNTALIDKEIYSAAEYNKLNMYLVKESEQLDNRYAEFDNSSDMYYLDFSDGNRFTFDNVNNLLYYNKICLCEDVQDFDVQREYQTGKEVLKIKVSFSNKTYTNKYTMAD